MTLRGQQRRRLNGRRRDSAQVRPRCFLVAVAVLALVAATCADRGADQAADGVGGADEGAAPAGSSSGPADGVQARPREGASDRDAASGSPEPADSGPAEAARSGDTSNSASVGASEPVDALTGVSPNRGFVSLSADVSCAVRGDGSAACWASLTPEQMSLIPGVSVGHRSVPLELPAAGDWVVIDGYPSSGYCGIHADGTLRCRGARSCVGRRRIPGFRMRSSRLGIGGSRR